GVDRGSRPDAHLRWRAGLGRCHARRPRRRAARGHRSERRWQDDAVQCPDRRALSDRGERAARGPGHHAGNDLATGAVGPCAEGPEVLLLDEPTAGMSPAETARITELIASLDRALTILIVEHDMDVVFRLADRISVLHEGRVIADGAPGQIRGDVRVNEVYLGKAVTVG